MLLCDSQIGHLLTGDTKEGFDEMFPCRSSVTLFVYSVPRMRSVSSWAAQVSYQMYD